MEEERRVAYVALTRACEAVLVTASGRRQSPFLREAALNPRFGGRLREEIETRLSELGDRLKQVGGRATERLGREFEELRDRVRRTLQ
jgi:superfamily I DNA/RNA helicase